MSPDLALSAVGAGVVGRAGSASPPGVGDTPRTDNLDPWDQDPVGDAPRTDNLDPWDQEPVEDAGSSAAILEEPLADPVVTTPTPPPSAPDPPPAEPMEAAPPDPVLDPERE